MCRGGLSYAGLSCAGDHYALARKPCCHDGPHAYFPREHEAPMSLATNSNSLTLRSNSLNTLELMDDSSGDVEGDRVPRGLAMAGLRSEAVVDGSYEAAATWVSFE